MRPTIFEALEVGLLHVPFHPDNPFLFCLFWLCFFIGIIVQIVLFQHCKGFGKWGFIIFSAIGFFCCEIACQIITGWDLILWLVLWFLFLTFLVGAGLCTLIYHLLKKKRGAP